jgi:hypothetical protein
MKYRAQAKLFHLTLPNGLLMIKMIVTKSNADPITPHCVSVKSNDFPNKVAVKGMILNAAKRLQKTTVRLIRIDAFKVKRPTPLSANKYMR